MLKENLNLLNFEFKKRTQHLRLLRQSFWLLSMCSYMKSLKINRELSKLSLPLILCLCVSLCLCDPSLVK